MLASISGMVFCHATFRRFLTNVPGNVRFGFRSERFLGRLSKFLEKWHVLFNATFRRILTNVPGNVRIGFRSRRFLGRLSEFVEKWHVFFYAYSRLAADRSCRAKQDRSGPGCSKPVRSGPVSGPEIGRT